MLSLEDRPWKEFFIKNIFNLKKGKCSNSENLKSGKKPYIGATNRNNGVVKYCDADSSFMSNGNFIAFIGQGEGSAGYSVYKKEKCICSTSIICGYNDNLNYYSGTFITTCSDQNKSKYSFGYSRNLNRLKNDKIMLPINDEGDPDWTFMENYIKQIEDKQKEEYRKFALEKLKYLEYKEIPKLEEKEWKAFFVGDIANIESGHDIYGSERIEGDIPYITSSSINNGIKYFVPNTNKTIESNIISVNRNGSVGYSFYHKYSALYSNDCRKLKLENSKNEYVALFIANQVTQQREKYSYGYKLGTARLKRQYIMLPINSKFEPDYDYMEQYVKNIVYKQLNAYLK